MLNCDFLVVGAGIVGLSTAHQLLLEFPGSSVIVVDKEDTIAAHQTGHNSGVIHAGVYYTPGSLKAEFCKSGNSEIKVFCQNMPFPLKNVESCWWQPMKQSSPACRA